MKRNVKPQSLFFFKPTLAIALTALASVIGQGAQASTLSLDQNFNAPFFAVPVLGSRAVLVQDDKYVMFFNLDTVADQLTGAVMRFNSDGSFDPTFSLSRQFNSIGGGVAPAPGGKLIIASEEIAYGVGSPVHRIQDILRLNSDGLIDSSFGPAQTTDGAEVRVISVNADGTIFVGGRFRAFNGQPNYGVVRLLSNGTLDPTFGPVTMTCEAHPFGGDGLCGLWAAPVIDGNGKILIGGNFITVNGVSALYIARLNSDGTIDNTFNASGFIPFLFGTITGGRPIRGIVIQSDGRIVIGGRF